MSDILTDVEVEKIESSTPTPLVDALILWGRHWQRASVQNRRLADDYKSLADSRRKDLAELRNALFALAESIDA